MVNNRSDNAIRFDYNKADFSKINASLALVKWESELMDIQYSTIQYNGGLDRPFRRREATSGTARTRARIAGERERGVKTGSQDPGVSQGRRRGS